MCLATARGVGLPRAAPGVSGGVAGPEQRNRSGRWGPAAKVKAGEEGAWRAERDGGFLVLAVFWFRFRSKSDLVAKIGKRYESVSLNPMFRFQIQCLRFCSFGSLNQTQNLELKLEISKKTLKF